MQFNSTPDLPFIIFHANISLSPCPLKKQNKPRMHNHWQVHILATVMTQGTDTCDFQTFPHHFSTISHLVGVLITAILSAIICKIFHDCKEA